jgi:integral membrane protein
MPTTPGTPPARAADPEPTSDAGAVRRFFTFRGLDGALLRYRVLAWTVGVGLATLVFVGIPLQIAGHAGLVAVAGPIHGFFYIVYLVAALDLARRARFGFLEMIAMVGAGFLPLLAFVIERRITRRVRTEVLPTWTLPRRRQSTG